MLIAPQIEAYAAQHSSALSPLLQEVLHFTLTNHPQSHMVSGKEQGLLLQFFSSMLKPKQILEIGTFTGFSGLCLATGLAKEGQLHTIELRSEDAATARAYFNRSAQASQICLHLGNALDVIPTLVQQWDLVFIDADKTGYIDYYQLVLPNLSANGIILVDNVLFHGEVLQQPITGKNAKAIAAFNEHIKNDNTVEHLLLTIRDGLMMIRKK